MFKKIGIIGAGVMGEVFIKQFIEQLKVNPKKIIACTPILSRVRELRDLFNIIASEHNKDGVLYADLVILSVKPQQAKEMLASLKPFVKNQVFLSIMAGVPLSTIQKELGTKKVIRCMPNTPAQIGYGMTVWKAGKITNKEKLSIQKILAKLGEEIEVKNENMIDAATAISGSGPAYVFDFASHLIASAVALGFTKVQAKKLVTQTIVGAGMLLKTGVDDATTLRGRVTSKGGTTEAAFKIIDKNNMEKIYQRATRAAYERALVLKKKG
jgi:pyrroline-5-carboxylate reductase